MKKSGFTIVELLIVIVVIAILAAISIVSYRGIADSAKNVSLLSAMDAYEKALTLYKIKNGTHPSTLIHGGASVASCLGEYKASGPFADGQCVTSTYSGGEFMPPTVANPAVNAALLEFLSTQPSPTNNTFSARVGDLSPEITNITVNTRGITYISDTNNPNLATLTYTIKSDQPCGRGEKTIDNSYGFSLTRCQIKLK